MNIKIKCLCLSREWHFQGNIFKSSSKLFLSFLGVPLTRLFPLCRTPLDVGRRVQHSGLSWTNMVAILKASLVELKVPSPAFYKNWKLHVALSCSAAGKDCGSTIWSRTFQLPQSISSVYLTPVICNSHVNKLLKSSMLKLLTSFAFW